jgi:hypothetical protein
MPPQRINDRRAVVAAPAGRAPFTMPGPGSVLTHVEPGRAVIWLIGDIDIALEDELTEIGQRVARVAPHIVIEPARLTFSDGVLAAFLWSLTERVPVTVRRPGPVLRQQLLVWGLQGHVQIADFPGPAPLLPA